MNKPDSLQPSVERTERRKKNPMNKPSGIRAFRGRRSIAAPRRTDPVGWRQMKLDGIHHITAITGDARQNVDFYVGTLGLRLVKKTVNQDDPSVYHLFYGDERGSPGCDLTFFEYPGSMPGRVGAGAVHTILWRVASEAALDFWAQRLKDRGHESERESAALSFSDPEGLCHTLRVYSGPDAPLRAISGEIPEEHALIGFDGVRAYARDPARGAELLAETLGFAAQPDSAATSWRVAGEARSSTYDYDSPPEGPAVQGAGSVHHVAFATQPEEHERWQKRLRAAGVRATPVIDRFYFKSIYFREPSGVLFELATIGPGFTADEPLEELGQNLSLPPKFEHLREQLRGVLTPLP
jgi:glyoxalase family protein